MTYQVDPTVDGDATALGIAPDLIDAVLEGGPTSFPAHLRSHRVPRTEQKVKIAHYGGYEHFERGPDTGDPLVRGGPVVFRWTTRTRVAE
ncbi:DUF5988 family protein [Micromonospora sp. NPDC049101]|uniref:DUF5988 family protein n=1 Tax=Micromonospora sp. NPDC049101 TaxID=3155032 RepID=UPI0033FCFCE1